MNKSGQSGELNGELKPHTIKRHSKSRLLLRFLFLGLLASLGLFVLSQFASVPEFPAESNGQRFAGCPDSPNCVSTQAERDAQRMKPIAFTDTPAEAKARLKQAIANHFTRASLVVEQETYLRYEFTSLIFRFVDDVEFLLDGETGQIQFRSASRVGRSDLGVNRRRMEKIAAAFEQ